MPDRRSAYQDAAQIVAAIEQAGNLRASQSEVIEHLRQIQLGWPAEREFAALSIWMSQCKLIHRLDKEGQAPPASYEEYRVPDLFAVYEVDGHTEVPVLIEVKSTNAPPLVADRGRLRLSRKGRLIFSNKYYQGLRRYADSVGLPLVVAWQIKNFGIWTLFDIEAMTRVESAYHADFPDIFSHDLLGLLLGNVHIQVAQGTKWELEIAKLEPKDEGSFIGRIDRSELISPNGNRYQGSGLMFPLFAACDTEVEQAEDNQRVVQSFHVPADEGILAHRLLYMAVSGFSDEEINWLTVIREAKFQWPYGDLLQTLDEGLELCFINHVIHFRPNPEQIPNFLKGKVAGRSTIRVGPNPTRRSKTTHDNAAPT